MAKERRKMFRRASRTNRSEDWGKYHRLDRKVKRTARANKRGKLQKNSYKSWIRSHPWILQKILKPSYAVRKGGRARTAEKGARSTLQR